MSLTDCLQVWLNDVQKVYPGKFKEPLLLKHINVPNVGSENIQYLIRTLINRNSQILSIEEDDQDCSFI